MVFTEHGDAWVGVTHNPQATHNETCGPQNTRSDSEPGLKFDARSLRSSKATLLQAQCPVSMCKTCTGHHTRWVSDQGRFNTYPHQSMRSRNTDAVDRLLKERWVTESDAQKIKAELMTPARTTSNNN
jgi:hypothetical protein